LESVSIKNMNIGDVFIVGGSPGHAVIVVDMAVNSDGEKIFLLAPVLHACPANPDSYKSHGRGYKSVVFFKEKGKISNTPMDF